jgi:cytochrome P450 family 6
LHWYVYDEDCVVIEFDVNYSGLRFGMMQTKVGLSILLKNYKFSVSQKTTVPLQMDPKNFIMSTEGGIWLDYTKV